MANEIETPTRKLSKRQLAELAKFTDPSTLLATLAGHGWNVDDAIEGLVEIAKNAGKEATRLAAIKYLNQLTLDAMNRAGLIVTASCRLSDGRGDEIKFTGHVVSDRLRSQKETESQNTQMPELLTPKSLLDETNEQTEEDNKKEDQKAEVLEEKDTEEPDMHLCKPPEGEHDEAGQFDGIAIPVDDTRIPGTLDLL
jgi:hypothetical protein